MLAFENFMIFYTPGKQEKLTSKKFIIARVRKVRNWLWVVMVCWAVRMIFDLRPQLEIIEG